MTAASSTPQCAGPSAAAHDSSRVKETRMGSIDTEVLVVGAGPAGSAAAYHLASSGVDVLLVDRARFPREKVCGDGLTPRAVNAVLKMGIDPTGPGFIRIDGVRTHGAGGPPVEFRSRRLGWSAGGPSSTICSSNERSMPVPRFERQ